ncbi:MULTISPECIES: AbrB/MazE/SpoVT family DNA-binding domain-containing protein [Protofrankia]|uniref:SpoVT/AbrB domain-containing protein n=1 Tax=Candidatus Protofrankia datiscae TaxID=2716812 RepID=F8B4T7_9ACTN|nr:MULTISPECIES: AbrB/MazE/SpoVT family DNA-binding domain-containing protein [Protofrankia]AEH10060.1 SpoVT/AbrB domain-containing protein [Candidatus Protofrankia datiscae]
MATEVKRRPGVTRVSRKHQVTLPVDVLRAAGLGPGDELRVTADGRGRLVLTAVRDPLEELIGSAPGLSAVTDLETLRNEWER